MILRSIVTAIYGERYIWLKQQWRSRKSHFFLPTATASEPHTFMPIVPFRGAFMFLPRCRSLLMVRPFQPIQVQVLMAPRSRDLFDGASLCARAQQVRESR